MKSTSASATSNLVHLSVSILASCLQAMIDSGAALTFIHGLIVQQFSLKTTPCQTARVTLADGRVLTHATRQVTLHYHIANVPQEDTFLVAPIGDHSIILGMPWLERVNPQIDWPSKMVESPLLSTHEESPASSNESPISISTPTSITTPKSPQSSKHSRTSKSRQLSKPKQISTSS